MPGGRRADATGHAAALSWEAARRVAASAAGPLPAVEVPLRLAYGRLAEPLRALVPVPGADVAAMDGYAVAGAPPWRVAGLVLAGGEAFGAALAPGTAVEIATGAPVPEGAEAVLPYEAAVRGNSPAPDRERTVSGAIEPGRHIRRRGEDCPQGTVVLAAGSVVTPAVLGLAAALGHDTLPVGPRPVVSVLVTGDEVVTEGLPGPGRVRDAIGPMLPGLVAWAGGRAEEPLWLPDGAPALAAALSGAGDGPPGEVIVVCGASSKGPADHLREVLAGLGAEILVDGVAVRPGHPQLLARLPGGRLVAGLPGNPYAALVAALTLLVPALRALTGEPEPPGERAVLVAPDAPAGPVRPHATDTRMVAVRRGAQGAAPVGHDRPGSLWGAALADALAVVPPGWRGEPVELVALPAQLVALPTQRG
ncbi:molybdopterin molybdotransferase MoeA [Streptosporangium lutulentum]|uniref:Molybdopterin molybdenumtransferase n=1 Tax=Streptosporangium lutulentum TaxID=1461250 RepID=A0ABT9QFY4_9ACTN|nr:molybdopterin molybdotransferase MoeA [Streptosporangium lutulentum]MDP9845602.1 molybdopterin molybdotransferase [Streptosporangium lutulentum]